MKKKIILVIAAAAILAAAAIWKMQPQTTPLPEAPKAPAVVYHWDFSTEYATLKVSAVGDSARITANLDSMNVWAQSFTARYKSDGTLDSMIFNAKVGDTVHLESDDYDLFRFALRFRDFSHHDIDVGIGNLLRAWKISWNGQGQVPSDAQLKALVADLKTPFYSLDSVHQALVILKTKHHFALGAFQEGRILDEMESRLREAGATSWLCEVSGDFSYHGRKPNGDPWVLGVKDPEKPEELLATVKVMDDKFSFCTSGDYEQKFTDAKGHSHHHILDPHTGQSTQGKHSVSVSTSIPWMNKNTLCTWFMILPLESIRQEVLDAKGGIETLVVLDSNRIWMSPGMREHATLLNDQYQVVP